MQIFLVQDFTLISRLDFILVYLYVLISYTVILVFFCQFQPTKLKNKKKKEFETNFVFVSTTEEYNRDTWNDVTKYIKRNVKSKVDDKIAKARKKLKKDVSLRLSIMLVDLFKI